ncbi:hypothetical protein CLAIMM_09663 [Cladophialophora immunda]|nr:hypothetical protein CLAIMM_09663 [Cladophialophora immunda]
MGDPQIIDGHSVQEAVPTAVPGFSNKSNTSLPSSTDRPAFSPEWITKAPSGYMISEHLIGEPPRNQEPFRILCLGAGASGIDFLHHTVTLDAFKGLNVEIICYEKNNDVGGTWLENRYPGCACDVPSVCYQFPWKPKSDWASFYSESREIWQYMRSIVDEEKLDKFIQYNTEVTRAAWNEDKSRWIITSRHYTEPDHWEEREEEYHFFVNASGFLNAWKWPDIPGLHDFRGNLYHTANYDDTVDLKGKRVAVIGSGSSGVQVVASIYQEVDQLYHWVRSPIWVTAGYGSKYAGENGANFQYSKEQQQAWARDEGQYLSYRKKVERELNIRFKFILRNTQEAEEALNVSVYRLPNVNHANLSWQFSYGEMARRLSYNQEIMSHIIPKNFNVGCRRPTPGTGYLEALVAPKTKVFFDTLHSITPNGFKPSSSEPEVAVDVIICATGFDTSFQPRFPVVGLNGTNVSELWQEHALGYISTGVPDMPNYFTYFGPYGPVAQGSLIPVATALSRHLVAIVKKMRLEHIRRLSPKPSVVADFGEHAKTYHHRTAWTDPCRSWFKQGRVAANPIVWPGSRLHYLDVLSAPKFEDYDIEYESGNRWGWLGSGFSAIEFNGGDVTYYLGEETEKDREERLQDS